MNRTRVDAADAPVEVATQGIEARMQRQKQQHRGCIRRIMPRVILSRLGFLTRTPVYRASECICESISTPNVLSAASKTMPTSLRFVFQPGSIAKASGHVLCFLQSFCQASWFSEKNWYSDYSVFAEPLCLGAFSRKNSLCIQLVRLQMLRMLKKHFSERGGAFQNVSATAMQ